MYISNYMTPIENITNLLIIFVQLFTTQFSLVQVT